MLSGYRLMWIMVMFDLPVMDPKERKAASGFRNALLDMGFEMAQYSVYLRFCTSQSQVDSYCSKIQAELPTDGRVNILQFTDKQYERIIAYRSGQTTSKKMKPDQFDLF
jgi:CRISPR-associated protein Cas2